MTTASARSEDQSPVQYLGLCRVAMGKTIRVKDSSLVFPDDPRVGALHFTNEEYLVRCPDAVVPEFIIQYRVATPSPPLAVSFTINGIAPVSLTATTPSLASSGFQDFIYSAAFDSTISAFPLALPTSDRHRFFFAPNELPASSRSTSPDAPGQGEHGLTKKTDEQQDISPEIVLANCVRQKTELREDLQRLERLFWARAREIWEEEAIRSGLKLQRDKRIHTFSEEAQARNQELRGELAMLSQMQDDIDRVTIKPTHKPRAQHSKHSASNSHRRR
ncbi:unnamed protein product [Phytophthora lilii]|uniref:Unnamed protein product n=1 Tax=Phytophthora lilii TaxID=2077276 RepID=A0A9W6WPQ1_9STRA|nr:unnamed protein product [Phytophthora lilii]